ncbi:MAG: hypothetical protein AAFP26_06430 [Planctomycetota bacterium]
MKSCSIPCNNRPTTQRNAARPKTPAWLAASAGVLIAASGLAQAQPGGGDPMGGPLGGPGVRERAPDGGQRLGERAERRGEGFSERARSPQQRFAQAAMGEVRPYMGALRSLNAEGTDAALRLTDDQTKAIREALGAHREQVRAYLEANKETIAGLAEQAGLTDRDRAHVRVRGAEGRPEPTAEQQAARTRLRELIGKGPKTEPVIAVLKQALTPEQLAHVEQQIEANGARDAARGTPRDRARGADRQGTRAGTRPGGRQPRAPRMDGLELPAPGLPGPGD